MNVRLWLYSSDASPRKEKTVRLLCFAVGGLLWVILALAIYAKATRTLSTGVTLSIIGGAGSCSEGADVSCVISNGSSNVISFFRVYDDGFGCSIEWLEGGNWVTSGVTWCATGREIVKLNAAEVYSFKAKVPLDRSRRRLSVEYWDGEPLVSVPKHVKSDPFVCVPTNCSAVVH